MYSFKYILLIMVFLIPFTSKGQVLDIVDDIEDVVDIDSLDSNIELSESDALVDSLQEELSASVNQDDIVTSLDVIKQEENDEYMKLSKEADRLLEEEITAIKED